ncbi:MAG TPA: MFS transporter [Actinomycetota bacterium]|nr:MFS transporter [Actinomycetota bacterium]
MEQSRKPNRAREQAEEALLEAPRPHAGARPPRLLANRPFLWLAGTYATDQLGFWAFLLAVIGEAGYRFHASATQLAILFAAFSVVFIPLTVPFGMLVDRWSPKWMLFLSILVMVGAVASAMAARSMPLLYLAFALDGVAAAMMTPARGSLTGLLVEEKDLVRANGMLNAVSMVAVIAGPLIAALLERGAAFDPAVYWFALAATAVGFPLVLVIPDLRPKEAEEQSFLEDLAEGFRVSMGEPQLRSLLVLTGAAWFLATVLVTFEPLFVKHVLHRGLDALGYLWVAHGVGALVGAVVIAGWRRAQGREILLIGVALVIGGAGYLAYVGTTTFDVAMVGSAFFGLGIAWLLTLSQALIQRVAAENLRGRVTGVVGMLQEAAGFVCAVILAVIGGLIIDVRPYLIWSGVGIVLFGVYGLVAARRFRPVAAPAPPAAPAPGNDRTRAPAPSTAGDDA